MFTINVYSMHCLNKSSVSASNSKDGHAKHANITLSLWDNKEDNSLYISRFEVADRYIFEGNDEGTCGPGSLFILLFFGVVAPPLGCTVE
jgi:hypothetical protein